MSATMFTSARSSRRTRRALTVVVLAAALTVAAWYARAPLLRAAADAWIVSDALSPADAVAVFGGGLETRPFAAADCYRAGLAKKVLLADVRQSPSERLGVVSSHVETNRAVMVKLGVPPERIEAFGAAVSSTYEEALALREWVRRTHAAVVIVPTESFSSRRVRWVVARALEGTGARLLIRVIDPLEYTRADWWRHEEGVIAFQNEVLKYLYYRFKYRHFPRET